MRSTVALFSLLLPAVLAAREAQIYLSPRPPGPVLRTSARDANALLSSHLGIAEYEEAPATAKTGFWDALGLPSHRAPWEGSSDALIIMVEGSGDGRDYLPTSITTEGPTLSISSPPSPTAFDALISVYLRRIARTFSLHLADIHGVEQFAQSTASVVESWAEWAVDGLHESWTYFEQMLHGRPDISLPVEPKPQYNRLITELDLLDHSAHRFVHELGQLDRFVEAMSVHRHRLDFHGPSHAPPRIAALRFQGLQEIERAHGRSSKQYVTASDMFRRVLEAAISAFNVNAHREGKVVALVVPPRLQHPAVLKRSASDLLAPFSTRSAQIFAKRAEDSKPIATLSRCYSDADTCKNQTQSCSGHGSCVEAATYGGSDSDKSCYVCKCEASKGTAWTGASCQKVDYSTQFFLLVGTTVGLLVVFWTAISLMSGVGSQPLPPTLAAVSGMGHKEH